MTRQKLVRSLHTAPQQRIYYVINWATIYLLTACLTAWLRIRWWPGAFEKPFVRQLWRARIGFSFRNFSQYLSCISSRRWRYSLVIFRLCIKIDTTTDVPRSGRTQRWLWPHHPFTWMLTISTYIYMWMQQRMSTGRLVAGNILIGQ